jgi:hypothetical protein
MPHDAYIGSLTITPACVGRQPMALGDAPVLARAPLSFKKRVARATAFGSVHLVPVLSAEVIP